MRDKIRIAVQKSGRLKDSSLKLLKDCGISIENGNDQLKATASNFPLELLFLRNSDIPQYVEDGVADAAIIGENTVIEKEKELIVIDRLGFSGCRVSLAIPKDVEYKGLEYFQGKRIATSYTTTLQRFLDKNGIDADLHEISGSVEIAPNIGLADGICDIVSTGSTLFKNGLKEVEVILKSEACLVSGTDLPPEVNEILQKLMFRIKAVTTSRNNKYVLLNAPNDQIDAISAVLPGMKSPTVLPLAEEGWSSLHSVVREKEFWGVIDQLKDLGAEGILIVPIEKMVL